MANFGPSGQLLVAEGDEKRRKHEHGWVVSAGHAAGHVVVDAAAVALGGISGGLIGILDSGNAGGMVIGAALGAAEGVGIGEAIVAAFDALTGYNDMDENTVPSFENFHHNMAGSTYKKTKKRVTKKRVPRALTYAATRMPEVKHIDVWMSNAQLVPASTWKYEQVPFFPIQGVDVNNRVGRHVRIVKLDIACRLEADPATLEKGNDEFFMQIWQDKRTNGASNAIGAVYDQDVGTVNRTIRGLRNTNNLNKFKLLVTHKHDVMGMNSTHVSVEPAVIKHSLKVNIPVEFSLGGGTPTIADVTTNSLFITYCNTYNGTGMLYDMRMRIWFVDV